MYHIQLCNKLIAKKLEGQVIKYELKRTVSLWIYEIRTTSDTTYLFYPANLAIKSVWYDEYIPRIWNIY